MSQQNEVEVPTIDPEVGYAVVGSTLFFLGKGSIMPCPSDENAAVAWIPHTIAENGLAQIASRSDIDVFLLEGSSVYIVDKLITHDSGSTLCLCGKIPDTDLH